MSPSESPEAAKRSKGGCYNCRVRKVKCRRPSSSDDSAVPDEACQNCSRLRFECRWTAPAPGEDFTPPPKRRRTLHKTPAPNGQDGSGASASPQSQTRVDGRLSSFGLPSDPAGPSRTQDDVPSLNGGTAATDFDSLWNDLLDLGNLPPVSMDWNQALDIVLPQQSITELPELSPYSFAPSTSNPGIAPATVNASMVDWTGDNHPFLIRHYLEVMKGYAKVEDRDRDSNNVYLSAFTRALTLPPLYNAILAYSASHISLVDLSYTVQARDLANLAYQGIQELAREDQLAEPEAILSALFILVKREHMLGHDLTQYNALADIAAGIVERPATLETMMRDPQCFAKRIVQRLLLIDSRASLFRLPGGAFGERMKRIDPLADVFLHDEQSSSADLLRTTLLRHKVGELDRRLYAQLREGLIASPPVHRTEITGLQKEIHQALIRFDDRTPQHRESTMLDANVYNRYMVASLLHAALLYLHLIYPLPADDPHASINRILEMQLAVARDPSRAQSPGSIWPSSLFFAGVAAEDLIHQDWILEHFRRAETWGHNIRKAKELLEVVMDRRANGAVIEVGSLIREVSGEFIL